MPRTAPRAFRATVVALVALAIAVGACGSSDDGDGLALNDVWTRPTAPGAESTAFYVTIDNNSEVDDQVVGVDSPRCAMTELHRSSMNDGVMSMSPAEPDELAVAASEQLLLEPGGLHVMCMGLIEPVAEGDRIELTVQFERAGSITTEAMAETR